MVGIVVVSHSHALAAGAVALAEEMINGRPVRIEIAAGLDATTFGTDATQIVDAIRAADDDGGVVVLMDLGSAVLSAEFALELLDDDVRERVVLCPAPLVEGLIVAAVAAATGAGRAEIAAEAAAALAGKQSHFDTTPIATPTVTAAHTGAFTVTNVHGLHARPAAKLVAQVRAFDATVEIRNASTGSSWVPASSLSRVATLGAVTGNELELRADGAQAREAIDRVLALAASAFDEKFTNSTAAGALPRPASPGIGIGPAWSAHTARIEIPDVPARDSHTEWTALLDALAVVHQDLQRARAATATAAEAAIFDAHLLLLEDPDLLDDVRARIVGGAAAAPSWSAAITRIAGDFGALTDSYLRARSADVHAVGDQVLRVLLNIAGPALDGTGILIAPDLTPAEAAMLDRDRVTGVLLAFSSPTAHGAILAKAQGIPAVVDLGTSILAVPEGTPIAFDGSTGEVVIAPSEEVLDEFRARAARLADAVDQSNRRATAPAVTRDGVTVSVGSNVGSLEDAVLGARYGADMAGLVRTEFLFLGRTEPPDVDEQEALYRQLAEAFDGRRITLRTLDAGGDKPLGYLPHSAEPNPFLGVRGIRHSLANPGLLRDQLLAIIRLARDLPVSVMFPMVTTVAEVVEARGMLDDAIKATGDGVPTGLEVGIMIEVPGAALKSGVLASYVDFFSIGTNDLTQYTLAAERGNHGVAAIADPFDPSVLRLVDYVCRTAGDRVTVGVCGELATDPLATAALCGFGIRELSVAPRAIGGIKDAVRATDCAVGATVAAQCLAAEDAAQVRRLLDRANS